MEKHGGEFKNKILINLNYFGYQDKSLAEMLDDPIILFVYCALEILAGIFAIFGSYYGNLLSAILFFITNYIYFNPLLPENQISLFNTRTEVFYNIGIFLSLLVLTYYPYESVSKVTPKIEEDEQEEQEEEEVVRETAKETAKSQKKVNKKNLNPGFATCKDFLIFRGL